MKDAFSYQTKLWENHKEENGNSHNRHVELFKEGHSMTLEGKTTGPYLTYITRFYSNGESLKFYELASLSWACNVLTIW